MTGAATLESFEGGFFLVQGGWIRIRGRRIKFIEFIGYDEARKACMSRLFGDRFAYEWEADGNDIRISFGRKGSGSAFTGRFSADGGRYSGAWKWPGGGYSVVAKRVRRT